MVLENDKKIEAKLYEVEGEKMKKLSIKNEKQAQELKDKISSSAFSISEIENKISDLRYFLSGILNFQKGINSSITIPILKEAIRIGGTLLLSASFAIGKALPCVAIIKSRTKICFNGTI